MRVISSGQLPPQRAHIVGSIWAKTNAARSDCIGSPQLARLLGQPLEGCLLWHSTSIYPPDCSRAPVQESAQGWEQEWESDWGSGLRELPDSLRLFCPAHWEPQQRNADAGPIITPQNSALWANSSGCPIISGSLPERPRANPPAPSTDSTLPAWLLPTSSSKGPGSTICGTSISSCPATG